MTEGIIQKVFTKFNIEYPFSQSKDYINQEAIDKLQQKLISEIKKYYIDIEDTTGYLVLSNLIGDSKE